MTTDTPAVGSPRDQLISRVNDALLRAELIRAVRDFQRALKDWQRPANWGHLPEDFMKDNYVEPGDENLLPNLILRIGIDPDTAKAAVLNNLELTEDQEMFLDEFATANKTWPEYVLELITEDFVDDDFTRSLLNRDDSSLKLVEAFDRICDLYQRHYQGHESHTCLDEGFNLNSDLDDIIDAQSRMMVQLYQQVATLAGRQYHAVVERSPNWVDDEYQFLQHTMVRVTLLDNAQPIGQLTLVAETDVQNRPFSDDDYFNFKDSMSEQSADFAEMLIELVANDAFDEDSVFEMLRFHEGDPCHNAFLHIHTLEFWQTSISPGLAVAIMLQAAIRGVTESCSSNLMTAPMDTPLESLLEADFAESAYEPLPVEWPALCDRVAQVFIVDPFEEMVDVLASSHFSESQKADFQALQSAAMDAYQNAGQYLPADLRERIHLINPAKTDFLGGMLRLAKHSFR